MQRRQPFPVIPYLSIVQVIIIELLLRGRTRDNAVIMASEMMAAITHSPTQPATPETRQRNTYDRDLCVGMTYLLTTGRG